VVGFQQAVIKVEKEAEFEQLRSAIGRAFKAEKVEKFLREVRNKGLRVRDWDAVLARGVLEAVDKTLNGKTAQGLYDSLSVSDKAQIREFYLFRVEDVDPKLRTKFHKLYQYY
jgi:hypothetical protein